MLQAPLGPTSIRWSAALTLLCRGSRKLKTLWVSDAGREAILGGAAAKVFGMDGSTNWLAALA